jgi:hypothetical protein
MSIIISDYGASPALVKTNSIDLIDKYTAFNRGIAKYTWAFQL